MSPSKRYANEANRVNQTCRKDQFQVPKMGAQLLTLSIFLDTCRLVAQLQIYASVVPSLTSAMTIPLISQRIIALVIFVCIAFFRAPKQSSSFVHAQIVKLPTRQPYFRSSFAFRMPVSPFEYRLEKILTNNR